MDYILDDLQKWNDRIEEKARSAGLDYYPQEFEIVNYNDMIACEAYVGMPSRYPHWSFGKSYEKTKTLYKYNLTGLPYEMVINSDPCIAYLMKDNTLLLQILTMAHVYGHNDFFKNNRLFKEGTDAKYTAGMFKSHSDTIRRLINDPSIGYENTERILDAAHAIKLQTNRVIGIKKVSDAELKKNMLDDYKERSSKFNILEPPANIDPPDVNKVPLEPEDDLIKFILDYGELSDWEKIILEIVRSEAAYFIPQIETKIMNEGWASYWHYEILKRLDLPTSLYIEFIKRHNDVVRPVEGGINPYYLGFEIFKDLAEKQGVNKIFDVRSFDRDQTFIRRYLTLETCARLNLFQYGKKGSDYIVEEISDEDGWMKIRNALSDSAGMGMVPHIMAVDMSNKDRALTLQHAFDGKELHRNYAEETLKYIADLWKHTVMLKTKLDGKDVSIKCYENKRIEYAYR